MSTVSAKQKLGLPSSFSISEHNHLADYFVTQGVNTARRERKKKQRKKGELVFL